jgi:hypothetical protein
MFVVINKETEECEIVYDVMNYAEDTFGVTRFLMYKNDGWAWSHESSRRSY